MRPSVKAQLKIYPEQKLHEISRYLHGSFAEHLGRCTYDGIWALEESPAENIDGYRKDVLEALKRLRIPVLRWPGGCFADTYYWQDGVGSREERKARYNYWWKEDEPNSYGTDEFFTYCELLDAEPYLSLNMGSGTLESAINWLEYTTGEKDTYYANWRRKNCPGVAGCLRNGPAACGRGRS